MSMSDRMTGQLGHLRSSFAEAAVTSAANESAAPAV